MSQSYLFPLSGSDSVPDLLAATNAHLAAAITMHSGTSRPSYAVAGTLWLKSSTSEIYVYDGTSDVLLHPDITGGSGAGLVLAAAGAFTTAAPTSAVAAAGSTALTRKNEVDARARAAVVPLGAVSATTSWILWCGMPAITVVDLSIASAAGTTSDGSNNWTFQLVNATASTNLRSSAKSTNGAEIVANTTYDLGLDQNLSVAADAVLRLTATLTGAPGALSQGVAVLRYLLAT